MSAENPWKINETSKERRRRELEELEFLYEAKKIKDSKMYHTPGAAGFGGVGGGVIDGPLAGATVTVVETGKTVKTNTRGQFKLRAVPTGKLEATNGIDTITNVEYRGTLVGVPGEMIISPLSNVASIIMGLGESQTDAQILLAKAMITNFGLQEMIPNDIPNMLKIDYIVEATQNSSSNAVKLQGLSTVLELTANLAANVIAGSDVNGNIEDIEYESLLIERKKECWEKIANKIKDGFDFNAATIIEEVAPDNVNESIQEATAVMVDSGIKQIGTVVNNSAINARYASVVIQSTQLSLQNRAESMSTITADEGDIGDTEYVLSKFGHNEIEIDYIENRFAINRVNRKETNLTVETYNGIRINKTSIYYLEPVVNIEGIGNVLPFGEENILYSEKFEVGYGVWTSTKVLTDGIVEDLYRYNWSTEEAQEDYVLCGNCVITISSLIGEAPDDLNKNKQAYISNIEALDDYIDSNDIVYTTIPRSDKIALDDPNKGPDILSDGQIAESALKGLILNKVDPAEAPVLIEGGEEGVIRTEEVVYRKPSEEGVEEVEIKKVLEVIPGEGEGEDEVVTEEFLLEQGGKIFIADFDVRDSNNVEEGEEGVFTALAVVQDKEFREIGKEEAIAARSKSSQANYLEEAEDCMGVAGGDAQIDECDYCYEDGPADPDWNGCLGE